MATDIYKQLHDAGIFQYGSNELKNFEAQLTKYFTREYKRHKDNPNQFVELNQGPLTLESKELADNHYDSGISFFKNFLDSKTMSYSMAYYNDDPDAVSATNKSLEEAQIDKFKLIARRMKLKGDETLLNLGCGFGYFESYLLDTFQDMQISSLTHSKDQYDFIMQRRKDSNNSLSSDRFSLFFGAIDVNSSVISGKEKYDIVSSVGMMEHINNVGLFFDIIYQLLAKNGRMFHHLIVSRDLIPQLLDSNKTLIADYFPGGKVLPFNALRQSFKNFELTDSWFVNGMNYWKTLDEWHANFWRNLHHIYPEKMNSERVRYWNNYFVLCKAMFRPENGLAYGNGQYLYYKKH